MSATPSKATTMEAGAPVSTAQCDSNAHPLVRLTSMHGIFVLESVGQWVIADKARQEEGTPDSLEYLSESTRFLMDAIRRQQDMGTLCRLTGGGQKASLMRAEATYPVLREIGLDTSQMEAAAKQMRAESAHLEKLAEAHAGNADHVVQLLMQLEARVHAVLTNGSVSGYASRPN